MSQGNQESKEIRSAEQPDSKLNFHSPQKQLPPSQMLKSRNTQPDTETAESILYDIDRKMILVVQGDSIFKVNYEDIIQMVHSSNGPRNSRLRGIKVKMEEIDHRMKEELQKNRLCYQQREREANRSFQGSEEHFQFSKKRQTDETVTDLLAKLKDNVYKMQQKSRNHQQMTINLKKKIQQVVEICEQYREESLNESSIMSNEQSSNSSKQSMGELLMNFLGSSDPKIDSSALLQIQRINDQHSNEYQCSELLSTIHKKLQEIMEENRILKLGQRQNTVAH